MSSRNLAVIIQPASTQCGVGPVYFSIELLSTYFNLPQLSVMLVQCVSPLSYCQPTSTCLNSVWCWSSVCPHWAIVNLLQPASTQCDVDPQVFQAHLMATTLLTLFCLFFSTFQLPSLSVDCAVFGCMFWFQYCHVFHHQWVHEPWESPFCSAWKETDIGMERQTQYSKKPHPHIMVRCNINTCVVFSWPVLDHCSQCVSCVCTKLSEGYNF